MRAFAMQVIGQYTRTEDRELLGDTIDYYASRWQTDFYPDPQAVQAVLDVEEHPAARTTRPEAAADYRFAEQLRASDLSDRLPR